MYEHVYRTVILGSVASHGVDANDSLIERLRPTGFDRYTGLILFTPVMRLAVLEGPAALHVLHRHALSLAGLSVAETLLNQRTTFRWFSSLMVQQHEVAPAGFTKAELTALATQPPKKFCNYITTLAQLGDQQPPLAPALTAPAGLMH